MAERSFKEEVEKLKLGAGETFSGEGILAVPKALLQSGVSYVSGYQGAPISHLVDVLADANDILTELGFAVVGPFSRLSEAMVAAVHEEIDAGIIDVNLGGEFVYPVADVLVAREIPFVFVTGYGVESIDARFSFVPIVKKPVQRQALQRIFVPVNGDQGARLGKRRNGPERERVRRAASALP